MSRIRFHHFAWGLLLYMLPAIVWGAYVRASHSGDGCGAHWPLCNGQVIPEAMHAKTWVEYGHRLSTGILLPLSIALVVWAFRAFGRNHPVRIAAAFTLFFMCTEALIGARLVLHNLVADNASVSRAIYMAAHLVNTFLLLAALLLTAWWGSGRPFARLRGRSGTVWMMACATLAVLILGISGAVTALGDTLFPARNLNEAVLGALSPLSHFLIRLRLWHPLLAITLGFAIVLIAARIGRQQRDPVVTLLAGGIGLQYAAQLVIGFFNARLMAPIPMQLVHLLMADLIWLNVIALGAAALAEPVRAVQETLLSRDETQAALLQKAGERWPVKSPSLR
ncbi:MAG TPA: COX15/CtaA family protein [Abditibacteriaceae bacterium]|jgi:heme A synthase